MTLTRTTGVILVLCLCLALSLSSAADQITKGDKALRAGDRAGAIAAYQKALNSHKADVREDVIERLARVGGPEATLALSQALKDADPDVVEAAADALRLVRDPAATQALADALNFPLTEDKAKRKIIRALSQTGGVGAPAAIAPLLTSPDKKLRREAAQAMALVGTQADLPALEAAANDMDMEVRMAVQQAITQAKTRPAPPPPAPPAAEDEAPAEAGAPAADEPDPAPPAVEGT